MKHIFLILAILHAQIRQSSPLGNVDPKKVTIHVWRGENMHNYGDDDDDDDYGSHAPFMYTIYQPVAKYEMDKNKGNLHKAQTEIQDEYLPFGIEPSSEDFLEDHVPSGQTFKEIIHDNSDTEETQPKNGRRVCECYFKYDEDPYRSRRPKHSYRNVKYPKTRFRRQKKGQKYDESKLSLVKYKKRRRPKSSSRRQYSRYHDDRPYGRFSGYSPYQRRYKKRKFSYNRN